VSWTPLTTTCSLLKLPELNSALRDTSQFLDELGVRRSHVAIHEWVHQANLQPLSTVSPDQLAVDERVIRVNGDDYWLYGAVDPETNEILQLKLFPTATKQMTRWFLDELHRRYQLTDVELLVNDADYLVNVLDEDGYRFQMISHGNRNAIERIFWEIERRTSSFQIVSAMSTRRQQNHGSKPSPSATTHAKINATERAHNNSFYIIILYTFYLNTQPEASRRRREKSFGLTDSTLNEQIHKIQ